MDPLLSGQIPPPSARPHPGFLSKTLQVNIVYIDFFKKKKNKTFPLGNLLPPPESLGGLPVILFFLSPSPIFVCYGNT